MKILITIIVIIFYSLLIIAENKQKYRYEYFLKRHKTSGESITDAHNKAIQQKNSLINKFSKTKLQSENPIWEQIGPGSIGGRIRDIEVSRKDPNVVWATAAAGGIWKTTNGGAAWFQIFDEYEVTSFGAISIDPNDEQIIYAATGEGAFNIDSYPGKGIYKTTNGGNSWFRTGLHEVLAFNKIFVHPRNSNIIYAGGYKGITGLYKSEDAGRSWLRLLIGPVSDISISENDPDLILVSIDNRGIYLSNNGGATFSSLLEKFEGINKDDLGRISAQLWGDDQVIWALIEHLESGDASIIVSEDQGISWEFKVSKDQSFFGINDQGFYNNFLEIHPDRSGDIITGGVDLYRINGGINYEQISYKYDNDVHVDQHCADFFNGDPNIVYLGNDGGIYKSTNAGKNWQPVNNELYVTQFYGIDIDQRLPNAIFGGTQDNNNITNRFDSKWQKIGPGDGFEPAVNQFDPELAVIQAQFGNIWFIDFRRSFSISINKNLPSRGNSNSLFNSPLQLDYNNELQLYHGGSDLWRIDLKNLDNKWERIGIPNQGLLSAIEPSQLNSNLIWVGTENGELFLSTNNGLNFQDVSQDIKSSLLVSDIQSSNFNEEKVIVSLTGYGGEKLFETSDGGQSWVPLSKNLPDVPINSVEYHPDDESIIYIGTDIGVFASYDAGNNWFVYGEGLPNSPIVDIDIYKDDKELAGKMYLIAATHGRSTFRAEIKNVSDNNNYFIKPAGGEIFYTGKTTEVIWFREKNTEVFFSSDNGDSWEIAEGTLKNNNFEWKIPDVISDNCLLRIELGGRNYYSKLFSVRNIQQGSVFETHNVGHVAYGIELGPDRKLYTTDFNSNNIYVIDPYSYEVEEVITLQSNGNFYTDIDIDDEHIYTSRLITGDGGGAIIEKFDYDGKLIDFFEHPSQTSNSYPIGLALINDQIVLNDRENGQLIYYHSKSNFDLIKTEENICNISLGPRGITEMEGELIQLCTNFGDNVLNGVTVSSLDPNSDFAFELQGNYNARGIAYDPLDGNFWISDFSGNIIKVGGFGIISSINEFNDRSELYPNPTKSEVFIRNDEKTIKNVEILDFNQKLISSYTFRRSGNSINLKLNNVANGIYYVVLFFEDETKVVKKLTVLD